MIWRRGIPPRWTSSGKSGVGTAAVRNSQVWFTVSHGIVNEVYFPRLDQANTRDCGLLITDGAAFFSEEKRHAACQILPLAQGVPGYQPTNTCVQGRYRVGKTIVTDPDRDVLLQRVRFEALQGALTDYHLYVLAPANVRWSVDGWHTVHDTPTTDTGVGLHYLDLPTAQLAARTPRRHLCATPRTTSMT